MEEGLGFGGRLGDRFLRVGFLDHGEGKRINYKKREERRV